MMNVQQSATKPERDMDALKLIELKPFKLDAEFFNSYLYMGKMVVPARSTIARQDALSATPKYRSLPRRAQLTPVRLRLRTAADDNTNTNGAPASTQSTMSSVRMTRNMASAQRQQRQQQQQQQQHQPRSSDENNTTSTHDNKKNRYIVTDDEDHDMDTNPHASDYDATDAADDTTDDEHGQSSQDSLPMPMRLTRQQSALLQSVDRSKKPITTPAPAQGRTTAVTTTTTTTTTTTVSKVKAAANAASTITNSATAKKLPATFGKTGSAVKVTDRGFNASTAQANATLASNSHNMKKWSEHRDDEDDEVDLATLLDSDNELEEIDEADEEDYEDDEVDSADDEDDDADENGSNWDEDGDATDADDNARGFTIRSKHVGSGSNHSNSNSSRRLKQAPEQDRIVPIVVKYPLMGSWDEWRDSFQTCKDEVEMYREIKTWRCPYLLRFYGTHGPGIVFEYVDGSSLDDLLEAEEGVENQTWMWSDVGEHCTTALHYLHSLNISHNDIKPQNVRYSKSKGIWKLLDLGLATDVKTVVCKNIGTDGYRAPEVASRGVLNHKSDVYGMGIMMEDCLQSLRQRYEAFATVHHSAEDAAFRRRILARAGKARAEVITAGAQAWLELDGLMTEVVARCLERAVERRPSIKRLVHVFRATRRREAVVAKAFAVLRVVQQDMEQEK